MTDLRTLSTFTADFPDDIVWSETEDVDVAGGRNVMEAIAALLRERGLRVSEPEEHSFYGWAFTATKGKEDFWFMLQGIEPWILISEARRGLLDKLIKRPSSHREVLQEFNSALKADPRFGEIRWFTEKGYNDDNVGAAEP